MCVCLCVCVRRVYTDIDDCQCGVFECAYVCVCRDCVCVCGVWLCWFGECAQILMIFSVVFLSVPMFVYVETVYVCVCVCVCGCACASTRVSVLCVGVGGCVGV